MRTSGSPSIAIAGAGNVGRAIARELLGNGHQVLLIDKDPKALKMDSVPSAEWLLADACEIAALDQAKLDGCQVLVAATGDDKVNLVASLRGKTAPLNPNTFSIRAKYNFTYNQSLSTQWNYVSRQVTSADYSNINRIPSYDTLDIRYAFKYSKRADFSVGIKNLMDKNYYSYSVIDWSSTAYYYPDPRRTFMASAKFMFD